MQAILDMLVDPVETCCVEFNDLCNEKIPPVVPDVLRPYPFGNPAMAKFINDPSLLRRNDYNNDTLAKMTKTDAKYWLDAYDAINDLEKIVVEVSRTDKFSLCDVLGGSKSNSKKLCNEIYDLADVIVFKEIMMVNSSMINLAINRMISCFNSTRFFLAYRMAIYLGTYYAISPDKSSQLAKSRESLFDTIATNIQRESTRATFFEVFTKDEASSYIKFMVNSKSKYFGTRTKN